MGQVCSALNPADSGCELLQLIHFDPVAQRDSQKEPLVGFSFLRIHPLYFPVLPALSRSSSIHSVEKVPEEQFLFSLLIQAPTWAGRLSWEQTEPRPSSGSQQSWVVTDSQCSHAVSRSTV